MNNKVAVIGGTLIGLAVGAAGGWFTAKKILTKHMDEVIEASVEAETELVRLHYSARNKPPLAEVAQRRIPGATLTGLEGEPNDEGPSVEVLERVIKGLKYGKSTSELARNVFQRGPVIDEGETVPNPEIPYVISADEYFEGEKEYTQLTLTYFAGDDVLADEGEMPLVEVDATVGNANLDRFGDRSKDPNVVYIRNDRLEIDYEVCKSTGKYAEEVAGFVEHSYKHPPRKFRQE